jgi:ATP-dependent DNA ligase
VIGKPAQGPYTPDKRTMLKFKHSRTADCVVAGLRWYKDTEPGTSVGSLLLGLYDNKGVLHSVGVVGSFPAERRRELAVELASLMPGGEDGHPWLGEVAEGTRVPGEINRWRSAQAAWVPLRRERVVEVAYEHTEGGYPGRFRHTAQFIRWRPDREPSSCGYEQLEEPAKYDLDAVLKGEVRSR